MFTDTKPIEDTTSIEHGSTVEMKKGDDVNIDAHKSDEKKIITKAHFEELITNADVQVEEVPCVTTTNISTYGASSCKFFLLTGTYRDEHFAYLDHDVVDYEHDIALDVLFSILSDIVKKLEEDVTKSSLDEAAPNLNNINIIIGGGNWKAYDLLRHAFSLMVDPDMNTQHQAKTFFSDLNVNILYDKLVKHVIILKSVSFLMSDSDEAAARELTNHNDVIDSSSLGIYYDCTADNGYIGIEWGTNSKLVYLAYLSFSLRSTEKIKLSWDKSYDEIDEIKNIINDMSLGTQKLEQALKYIPDDPVFDTVYTHTDIK